MKIKATGRPALILATGIFVCLAGPSQAVATTDNATASAKSDGSAPVALNKYTKHSTRHGKHYAHRKSGTVAQKAPDKKDAPAEAVADDSDTSSAIPPGVANANAQMAPTQIASNQLPSTDVPGGNVKAMSARASEIVQAAQADGQTVADAQVVAPDQLNEVDRALHEASPPAIVMASAETPAAAPSVASSSNEGSTWDQTSLIGKIFIGFGALLTMASAARMFMA